MTVDSANTGQSKKRRKGATDAEMEAWLKEHPFTFCTIQVDNDTKERIKDHAHTEADFCDFIRDVTTLEYKLSINWDNKHHCMVVSITGTKFWREDYNRCVTSRGPELWVALAMAMHKWQNVILLSGIPANTTSGEAPLD